MMVFGLYLEWSWSSFGVGSLVVTAILAALAWMAGVFDSDMDADSRASFHARSLVARLRGGQVEPPDPARVARHRARAADQQRAVAHARRTEITSNPRVGDREPVPGQHPALALLDQRPHRDRPAPRTTEPSRTSAPAAVPAPRAADPRGRHHVRPDPDATQEIPRIGSVLEGAT